MKSIPHLENVLETIPYVLIMKITISALLLHNFVLILMQTFDDINVT